MGGGQRVRQGTALTSVQYLYLYPHRGMRGKGSVLQHTGGWRCRAGVRPCWLGRGAANASPAATVEHPMPHNVVLLMVLQVTDNCALMMESLPHLLEWNTLKQVGQCRGGVALGAMFWCSFLATLYHSQPSCHSSCEKRRWRRAGSSVRPSLNAEPDSLAARLQAVLGKAQVEEGAEFSLVHVQQALSEMQINDVDKWTKQVGFF